MCFGGSGGAFQEVRQGSLPGKTAFQKCNLREKSGFVIDGEGHWFAGVGKRKAGFARLDRWCK